MAAALADNRALVILLQTVRAGRPVHVEYIPARSGRAAPWPEWAPAAVVDAFAARGIRAPWSHQVIAANHAQAGRNVILSTAAASGKSLGYLMPALTSVLAGDTALYITPSKALAADQLASIRSLGLPGLQAASFDGDSSRAERDWARSHARYLLTTPDMLHCALLPGHARWSGFFGRLRYVIIDECHGYRGVFGSHVAHVLRRLRRVVALVEVDGKEKEMTFLTNHLEWSPRSVADLYRCRWEIEVFFKQIKQTLQLADFLGNNANAVRWQVWTALLTYVLLRYLSYLSQWAHSFTRLFTLLRAALWEKYDLLKLLERYGTAGGHFRHLARPEQAYFAGL